MKKTKFTESQIVKAIKESENGRTVADISAESSASTHRPYTTGRSGIQAWMESIYVGSKNWRRRTAN
jgi:hypothetical protein